MTLQDAKRELKNAWISGEGYDYDETFTACYKDGTVLDTREANERLPQRNIIGIQFCGSDASYAVGYEIFQGKQIQLTDD